MGIAEFFSTIFTMKFLLMVIRQSTTLLFAAMAAFTAATTGVHNIAVEGIMNLCALFAILGSYWTQSAIGGVLVGIALGVGLALMIAYFSMELGANRSLVGIALNTFSTSLAIFFLYQYTGSKGSSASLMAPSLGTWDIPLIKDIPVLGEILSGHYVLTYVSWLFAIVLFIVFFKTPLGMRMRACGLNPEAARTAGINVKALQILALGLSGFFSAFGGIYVSLNYSKIFSKAMITGQGWMGVAANGIALGKYSSLIIATFAFGFFRAVSIIFVGTKFPSELITAVPYIAVFVGISIISIVNYYKVKRGNVAGK